MKSSLFSKLITASLALMFVVSAFAAGGSHKENFQISSPTQVNGKELPAGDYQAKWEGSGPSVQVSIVQGKKVIATVPAHLVDLDRPAYDSETETKNNSNGDRELTTLRFSGKKYALELGAESAKAQSKPNSDN